MIPFWPSKDNSSGVSLSGKISGVWNLVNETALLLSRTTIRARYERQLEVLRLHLQQAPDNPATQKEVSGALTEIRKQMRLAGYDLSMGKYTLSFDGFRGDESSAQGFRRVVLFITREGFFWKTGEENHITLAEMLERQLNKNPRGPGILEMHYLWYRRTKTTFVLSGAATETKNDYEKLKSHGEADGLLFLSNLKGLY
jgi:hypothetical protein